MRTLPSPNKKSYSKKSSLSAGLVLVLVTRRTLMFRIYIEFSFGARHPPDPYVPDLYQVDYEPALIYNFSITIKSIIVQNFLK